MRTLVLAGVSVWLVSCGSKAPPVCDASTCSTGCCDAMGGCQPGDTQLACGASGAECRACASNARCASGACVITGGGAGGGGGSSFGGGTGGGGHATGGGSATGGGGAVTVSQARFERTGSLRALAIDT